MKVLYCRTCKPKVTIAAAGPGSTSISGSHTIDDTLHSDTLFIDVPDNEWQLPNETTDVFLARLTENYGGKFT